MLSYLQTYEPQELKKSGSHEFCTVTHDSLKISNRKWHWMSQGIGGKTALDYLIRVRGMEFVNAVQTLCRGNVPVLSQPTPKYLEQSKVLLLPEATRCATAAISYLQRRGISSEIISRCMKAGIFYESKKYHNCVFVGKDKAGKARFACMRGTTGDFKADVSGSDKRFSFCLPSADPSSGLLAVFESPIDALSLATLRKITKGTEWDKCNYLSLGGTSPLALQQFLTDHPEINHIYLCLDNDKAGLEGMARIETILKDRTLTVERKPPPAEHGKDYNELLRAKLADRFRIRNTKEKSLER